jgi:hypothetical protein
MIAHFDQLAKPWKRLSNLGTITLLDVKRAFQEEKLIWDLMFPYVGERISGILMMMCGAWLIAFHGMTFANPSYRYIRYHITAVNFGVLMFFLGLFHIYMIYCFNQSKHIYSVLPMKGRRFSMFLETCFWVFLATMTFCGFPPGLGFIFFICLSYCAKKAFQDAGIKLRSFRHKES